MLLSNSCVAHVSCSVSDVFNLISALVALLCVSVLPESCAPRRIVLLCVSWAVGSTFVFTRKVRFLWLPSWVFSCFYVLIKCRFVHSLPIWNCWRREMWVFISFFDKLFFHMPVLVFLWSVDLILCLFSLRFSYPFRFLSLSPLLILLLSRIPFHFLSFSPLSASFCE